MAYDTDNFAVDVIERSHTIPVLVDFWAEWCAPCRVLGPVLERLAERHQDRWALAKIDTEAHPEIAQRYNIRSIPNVKLFVDGEPVDEFVGALPENMIEAWLQKALPSKYRAELMRASDELRRGNIAQGQKILHSILQNEPDNQQIAVMLARTLIFSDSQRALDLVAGIQEDSDFFDEAEAIRTLARLHEYLLKPETVPAGRSQQAYLLAIERLRNQDFDQALQGFIDIVASDRQYDDDGARRACIAIFRFLGEDHPITKKHRSGFSSALYA